MAARCSITALSLPIEYSMTGRSHSAATSRRMWMLSASRRWRCVRRAGEICVVIGSGEYAAGAKRVRAKAKIRKGKMSGLVSSRRAPNVGWDLGPTVSGDNRRKSGGAVSWLGATVRKLVLS